jgi:ATP-binding cassette subfamily C protein
MKQLLHLMKQLQRHAGHRLYFHLLGMVCASLLEGAGILLLIPMLSMSGVLGGAEPELGSVPSSGVKSISTL